MIEDDSNNPDGLMKIAMDMTYAPTEVDRLKGKLSNDDGDEIYFDFEIDENSATALVEDIPSGIWKLQVDAFDESDNLIYTGTTEITIYPGVLTPVFLQLNPATGSLEIMVTWGESCRDIDGNVYKTIKIGNQIWMAENLKVTHFRNGDAISNITNNSEWSGLTTGAYCKYISEDNITETFGLIYNWYAVDDSRNISPIGWHIPTDEEWKELEMYLGMSYTEANSYGYRGTDEGGKIKTTGMNQDSDGWWDNPNLGATNSSGFSALPSYYRYPDGILYRVGRLAHFWTSTEANSERAWDRWVNYSRSDVSREHDDKRNGWSVRCVKDNNYQYDDQFEENDRQTDAVPLYEYTYYKDLYVSSNDEDWYALMISADGLTITCDFNHLDGDINIDLVDKNGNILASSSGESDHEEIYYIVDNLETYYIHVYMKSGDSNQYTIWWDDVWQNEGQINRPGG